MRMGHLTRVVSIAFIIILLCQVSYAKERARDLGIPFEGTTGKFNAITDVKGVEVGHATLISGEGKLVVGKGPVRTGVTAIFPRGKTDQNPVFAAWSTLNGNGELTGTTWVKDSGFMEGPLCITNTNSVGTARDAIVAWEVEKKFYDPDEGPALAVAGETYDGYLNDIDGFHVKKEDVFVALNSAASGQVLEGNVGGGTGMICHQFKGGIGTSSRVLEVKNGGYTVGVLVQANHGKRRTLMIAGVLVGKEITDLMPLIKEEKEAGTNSSIIVVVATDAPLLPTQLNRLSRHVSLGIARVGGMALNSSGEIFIAFSTANPQAAKPFTMQKVEMLSNEQLDPLFEATAQATEEAIVNALIAAETMSGINGNTAYAIPHDRLKNILAQYNRLNTAGKAAKISVDKLIRVPLTRQGTDHTCGVASFQSVLAYYGESIREDNLGKAVKVTDEGTPWKNIKAYALKQGFNVDVRLNMTLDDLKKLLAEHKPVILAIQAWPDNPVDYKKDWNDGHYVVAVGYDNDNIYFMDPSTLGDYTFIPRGEFLARWHDRDMDGKTKHRKLQ